MAIGDRIPTELLAPTVLSSTATSLFSNASTNYRTQLTGIWVYNNGSSQRTVTLYKNGTASSNIFSSFALDANSGVLIDLAGKALVFTGTQQIAAKQDTGTDVNISAYGIVEQIA
ncbi:hypothetical protein [Cohnella silvisoli]|uniref:Uncharacterized protein n=1 Tax=Cohnella silvisoli TaxID=2873699 RepID=A0ABV1KNH5_9BACL|nr:hypothetical protein [Cohnella silvisoli]MCD9020512.1 hypothetical protein [Cohnella silvisoli]